MAFFYFQVASKSLLSETCRADLNVQFLSAVMKKYKNKNDKVRSIVFKR